MFWVDVDEDHPRLGHGDGCPSGDKVLATVITVITLDHAKCLQGDEG